MGIVVHKSAPLFVAEGEEAQVVEEIKINRDLAGPALDEGKLAKVREGA